MRKRKFIFGVFCSINLCLFYPLDNVDAAKNPVGKIKIIDGKEVSYDDNVVNGSVS